MNTFITRALWGTLLAGGIALFGATSANAAETTGQGGLLGGTQVIPVVNVPVTAGGNAVSIVGASTASAAPSAPAAADDSSQHVLGALAATTSQTLAATGGESSLAPLLTGFVLAGGGALALALRRRAV